MTQRILFAIVFAALAGGCTSRELYRAGQEHQRQECRSGPVSDYEACMRRADVSYEAYQEMRQALEQAQKGNQRFGL